MSTHTNAETQETSLQSTASLSQQRGTPNPGPPRRYAAPELFELGSVRQLTLGVAGTKQDGDFTPFT